jgi:hypothetical protein
MYGETYYFTEAYITDPVKRQFLNISFKEYRDFQSVLSRFKLCPSGTVREAQSVKKLFKYQTAFYKLFILISIEYLSVRFFLF